MRTTSFETAGQAARAGLKMSDKRKELLRACMQNEVDYRNLPSTARS